MNQNQRTLGYVGAAVLAVVFASEPWKHRADSTPQDETGKLFTDFADPLAATSMRIVKYDEGTGRLLPFEVAQVNGIWSIPSHQNYPADAKDHLAEAATVLCNLEILGVASTKPGEHEMYGVLDPDAKDLSAGATGVGTRVTMKDAKDTVLADLIIGKEVKDQPQLRFVRKPSQDQVYRVAVKTDKLSTKFGDWIEKDLLKLNAFDVRALQLNDYSVMTGITLEGQRIIEPTLRSEMTLDYDDTKSAWNLAKLVEYEDNQPTESTKLKPDEELNTEKLNGLKTALDDLQIVDVRRKPKGMKGLALLEDIVRNPELMQDLVRRGFYAAMAPDRSIEIYSSEGEVISRMKDGVEYVLRFGRVAGGEDGSDAEKADDENAKAKLGVNRFLFVSARFNQDAIAKPALEPLPGEEKSDAAADDSADKSAGDKAADAKADGAKPDDAKKSAADTKPAAEQPAADGKAKVAKSADEQAAEEDAAERKKADAEKRAALEKENKRKQDEYDEKVKKGQDHVKELNRRFADWFYIISDDVYHKIHLSRADVVKTKEKKAGEGDLPGDLKALEKAGLHE